MKLRNTADIPFAPRQVRFFYGWVILAVGTLGTLMSMPGQTIGVGAFTESLIEATGLERMELSMCYMYGTVLSSFLLTFMGYLFDRFGARVVGMIASVGLGGALLLVSQVDHVGRTLQLMMAGGYMTVAMTGCFFLLRFFGQGVMTLTSRNMTMKWFDQYRGLATAIAAPFVALGFNASPKLLSACIDWFGWRETWIGLAVFIGGIFTVIAGVFYRDNPEDCGLQQDGNLPPRSGKHKQVVHREFTLKESIATPSFWVYSLTVALAGYFATGFGFHFESIFRESGGMSKDLATSVFIPSAVVAIGLNVVGSYLSDKMSLRPFLWAMLLGISISGSGLGVLQPGHSRWLIAIGMGVSSGMFALLVSVTWPRFYGRSHLGAISGFNMTILVFSSAIAPPLFSASLESTGEYHLAGWTSLAAAAILFVASFWAKNPQKAQMPS